MLKTLLPSLILATSFQGLSFAQNTQLPKKERFEQGDVKPCRNPFHPFVIRVLDSVVNFDYPVCRLDKPIWQMERWNNNKPARNSDGSLKPPVYMPNQNNWRNIHDK